MTTISLAPLSKKMRINRSMSFSPCISTSGFGAWMPSLANREPSPAAMIAYFISFVRCIFAYKTAKLHILLIRNRRLIYFYENFLGIKEKITMNFLYNPFAES